MQFDIPMYTKGATDLGSLVNSQTSSVSQQEQPMYNPPTQHPTQSSRPTTPMNNSVSASAGAPVHRGGVSLRKGQKSSLTDAAGGELSLLRAGLYWDCDKTVLNLDASCFMLGDNGKVLGDDWFVFYGAKTSPDGAIQHSGDCCNGAKEGDDEIITVNLLRLDSRVEKLIFVVTINDERNLGLNFSRVSNAGMHLTNASNNVELFNFPLTDYYQNVTSMMVGEVYRHNGQWKFNPIGEGIGGNLYDLCARYGVNVSD